MESAEKEYRDSKDRIEMKLRRGEGLERSIGNTSPTPSTKNTTSKGNTNTNKNTIPDLSVDEYRQQLMDDRDRRIQHGIKAFHQETIALEVEWKQQHDDTRIQLITTKDNEEIGLKNHINDCNNKITHLVSDIEEIGLDITRLKNTYTSTTQELDDMKEQIYNYEANINKFKIRVRENESLTNYQINEEDSNINKQIKEYKRKIDNIEKSKHIKIREHEHVLYEIQHTHDIDLEMLEKTIKNKVIIKDKELVYLQEEITLEMNKFESLQELLKRYNKSNMGTAGGLSGLGNGGGSSSIGNGSSTNRGFGMGNGGGRNEKTTDRSEWNSNTSTKPKKTTKKDGSNSSSTGGGSVGGTVRSSRSAGSNTGTGSRYTSTNNNRSTSNVNNVNSNTSTANTTTQAGKRPSSIAILTNNMNRNTNNTYANTNSNHNTDSNLNNNGSSHTDIDMGNPDGQAGVGLDSSLVIMEELELELGSAMDDGIDNGSDNGNDDDYDDLTLATTVTGSINRYSNSNHNSNNTNNTITKANTHVDDMDDDLVQFMNIV